MLSFFDFCRILEQERPGTQTIHWSGGEPTEEKLAQGVAANGYGNWISNMNSQQSPQPVQLANKRPLVKPSVVVATKPMQPASPFQATIDTQPNNTQITVPNTQQQVPQTGNIKQ